MTAKDGRSGTKASMDLFSIVDNDRKRKRDRDYDRDRDRDRRRDERGDRRRDDRSRREERGTCSRRSYREWDETPRFRDEPATPDLRVKGKGLLTLHVCFHHRLSLTLCQ